MGRDFQTRAVFGVLGFAVLCLFFLFALGALCGVIYFTWFMK